MQYLDISLGKVIHTTQVTEDGALSSMTSNPTNGIIHIGHYNGTVTLWSPNQSSFVAKMIAHRVTFLRLKNLPHQKPLEQYFGCCVFKRR